MNMHVIYCMMCVNNGKVHGDIAGYSALNVLL
jgi:hypothetical protein